jgi:hypothetical protein
LTAYRAERVSLIAQGPGDRTSYGVRLLWLPSITENIGGRAEAGFRTDTPGNGQTYNVALGANYQFSPTFYAGIRYDFIRRETSQQGFAVNAFSVRLRKLL